MTSFHPFLAISVQQTTKMSNNITIELEPKYAFPLSVILVRMSKGQFPDYNNIQDDEDIVEKGLSRCNRDIHYHPLLDEIPKCHRDVIQSIANCMMLYDYDENHTSSVMKVIGTEPKVKKLKATLKWLNQTDVYRLHYCYYPVRVAVRLLHNLLTKFIECAERQGAIIDLENIMEQIDDE